MRSVTTKYNYQTALQHLIPFSIKHPQTIPHPALNEAPPSHKTFTIERARTWHYRKMRPCVEQSNGLVPLSLFPSWQGYITNTSGYEFRKGQALKSATGSLSRAADFAQVATELWISTSLERSTEKCCVYQL